MEDYYDDLLENEPPTSCPNCQRSYDDIDYDYQLCSKCGWDADENKFSPDALRNPTDMDYLSGDADILTGEWT
jgi:predicted amidophosphoribosyltransferase